MSSEGKIATIATMSLQEKFEYIEASIEEMKASNARMIAANEEMTAANAEMIAANEDMIAANKEMKASNEEMIASYHQIRASLFKSEQSNNDMDTSNDALEARFEKLKASHERTRASLPNLARTANAMRASNEDLETLPSIPAMSTPRPLELHDITPDMTPEEIRQTESYKHFIANLDDYCDYYNEVALEKIRSMYDRERMRKLLDGEVEPRPCEAVAMKNEGARKLLREAFHL